MSEKSNSWYALSIMMGTIVGAGIFGIPFAVQKSGILIGLFWLVFLGIVMMYVNLLLGEVCLRTPRFFYYVGFAAKYFAKKGKVFASLISITSLYGTLLAYLIIGGRFIYNVFHEFWGAPLEVFSLIFFLIGVIGILLGVKIMHKSQLFMFGLLLLVTVVILIIGLPQVKAGNLIPFNLSKFFLPYGVILFALSGASAVSSVVATMGRAEQKIKRVIILGSLIPLLLFLIFAILVVGVTGENVSPDAVSSLGFVLGRPIVIIMSVFGFLSVITSFFILAINLQETLRCDLKINRNFSIFLTLIVPLMLYVIGFRDFIQIIALLGVFLTGAEGILIVLLFRKARKQGEKHVSYRILLPNWLPYLIMAVFVIGILLEVYFFFGKL